jgi:hypothetical protein
MVYAPGQTVYKLFTVSDPVTGSACDATSTPVATANRNGVDDTLFTLTVSKIDTGRYSVTGSIPAGYEPGDVVNISVVVDVGSVSAKAVIETFSILDDSDITAIASAVSDIPTNPLLTTDSRLDHLDADISGIPTTPLLAANYTAPDNTSIAAIKTVTDKVSFTGLGPYYIHAQVKGTENLDFTSLQKASLNASTPASVTGSVGSVTSPVTVGTNQDKSGYSLSVAGILAIWNQGVAAAGILANTFGSKLRDWSLGTDNKALISADSQDLSGTLDVNAKTVEDKTGYALTSAYDAAKTAATQTSVNAIPTAPLLASDVRLDRIASIPTTPLLAEDYTAPDNASISAILTALQNATYGLSALDSQLDDIITALGGSESVGTGVQTLLTRLTNTRATLIDNLQYLTEIPGLTEGQIDILTEARDEAKLARQLSGNKAVISPDGLTVTIYADDKITPLWIFSTPDAKTRIPA